MDLLVPYVVVYCLVACSRFCIFCTSLMDLLVPYAVVCCLVACSRFCIIIILYPLDGLAGSLCCCVLFSGLQQILYNYFVPA